MSTRFRLRIPRQLRDQIVAQAFAEFPLECCGLLAGPAPTGGAECADVTHCFPLVNAAASPVEYTSTPESMFHAHKEMRRLGLEVLAVYHSHPTSHAVPSRTDRERNYSETVMNIIVSLVGGKADFRGWWLTADGQTEGEWEVVDDGGSPEK